MRATVMAIRDELTEGGLVLRYRTEETDDGLHGEEGTFLICSFWLVSALSEIGEHREAEHLCERLLSYASPLGLYAEELEASSGRHLGNYPQAFTHLALINAVTHVIDAQQQPEAARARSIARSISSRARRAAGCARPRPRARTRGSHRLHLASAGVGEQRVDGGELAQLLEVLDRREDQHDLAGAVGVERGRGREPAEVHALLAVDPRLLAVRAARRGRSACRSGSAPPPGVIQRENFTSASGSSSAIPASSRSSRIAAARWASSPLALLRRRRRRRGTPTRRP